MSKFKHTPGPWKVASYDDALCVVAGKHTISLNDQGYFEPEIDPKTNEANARLIAAAPEMLQTLKDLNELYGSKMQAWSRQELIDLIAKAEGRGE